MHFRATYSYMISQVLKLRLPATKVNVANYLITTIKEAGWTIKKILTVAATLELENMVAQKPGQGPQWQAQRMICSNCDINDVDESTPFPEVLQKAIKSQQESANLVAKESNGLMWLAVLYKSLDSDTILEMPIFLVISTDYQYLFSKKTLPVRLIQAVKIAAKCRKLQPLHLAGRHLASLLALLQGRDGASTPPPAFEPRTPKLNDSGCDFTRGTEVQHYTKQCLGSNIHLEQYCVHPTNKRWLGDETPELRLIEVKSEVMFSGDVSALLAALPAAGICRPPFPEYIRNFAIKGVTRVSSEL